MPSTHEECLTKATSVITALALAGIGTRVYKQYLPDETDVVFPCVLVTIQNVAEEVEPFDTASRQVTLPVQLFFLERAGPKQQEAMSPFTQWRQDVVDAFPNRRVYDIASVYGCEVRMGTVIEPKLPDYAKLSSSMVLRFVTTRPA